MISCSLIVCISVSIPNVTATAPENQTIGDPLSLTCTVTAVTNITNRVDIIWRRDRTKIETIEGVGVISTTDNLVLYIDTYNISLLNTTDDGREYQCEVVINTSPPVIANDSLILEVMGK